MPYARMDGFGELGPYAVTITHPYDMDSVDIRIIRRRIDHRPIIRQY